MTIPAGEGKAFANKVSGMCSPSHITDGLIAAAEVRDYSKIHGGGGACIDCISSAFDSAVKERVREAVEKETKALREELEREKKFAKHTFDESEAIIQELKAKVDAALREKEEAVEAFRERALFAVALERHSVINPSYLDPSKKAEDDRAFGRITGLLVAESVIRSLPLDTNSVKPTK